MSPRAQMTAGIGLIVLAFGAVALQITQHRDVFSLLAVLLGAVGGQQIGQANARGKHQQ